MKLKMGKSSKSEWIAAGILGLGFLVLVGWMVARTKMKEEKARKDEEFWARIDKAIDEPDESRFQVQRLSKEQIENLKRMADEWQRKGRESKESLRKDDELKE